MNVCLARNRINPLFLVLFCLFHITPLKSQPNYEILMHDIIMAEGKDQTILVDKLILLLSNTDTSVARNQVEKLAKITLKMGNIESYNHVLLFSSLFGTPKEAARRLFASYKLAEEREDKFIMGQSMIGLSEYYRTNYQYDSAAICALKAKSLYGEIGCTQEEAAVLHQLGNLFYAANLLDRAEKYFREVFVLKGDPSAWISWRKYVIINNIGLIEQKRKNYDKAIYYFNRGINELLTERGHILNYPDTNRLVYAYTVLSAIYVIKQQYDSASYFYSKGLKLESAYNRPENMTRLFITKGLFYYATSRYDSALSCFEKANKSNELFGSMEFSLEIHKSLSDIYGKLKDYKNAWGEETTLRSLEDSLSRRRRLFAGLILISDDAEAFSQAQKETYEMKQTVLVIIIIAITVATALFFIIYFKMQNTRGILVRRTLELARFEKSTGTIPATGHSNISGVNVPLQSSDERGSAEIEPENHKLECLDGERMKTIARNADQLIKNEELFLNPQLSLYDLAHLLNTNRTYLSQAINTVFGVHFNAYINNLRIKKAIQLISEHGAESYSLDGIAHLVGFANRVTFTNAFKQYMGVTPSFFIKKTDKVK